MALRILLLLALAFSTAMPAMLLAAAQAEAAGLRIDDNGAP